MHNQKIEEVGKSQSHVGPTSWNLRTLEREKGEQSYIEIWGKEWERFKGGEEKCDGWKYNKENGKITLILKGLVWQTLNKMSILHYPQSRPMCCHVLHFLIAESSYMFFFCSLLFLGNVKLEMTVFQGLPSLGLLMSVFTWLSDWGFFFRGICTSGKCHVCIHPAFVLFFNRLYTVNLGPFPVRMNLCLHRHLTVVGCSHTQRKLRNSENVWLWIQLL